MSLLRPRVRDDRGRSVRSRVRWPAEIPWSATGREVLLICAFVPAVTVVVILSVAADRLAAWVFGAMGIGALVVAYLHASGSATARAIVRAARCAGCGYDLRALPAAADGCTVCPECGAAWRVGDVVERG